MKRLAMRKIKEVIRLGAQGLSPRRIGESLGIGRTTVQECLGRARAAGLSWPLPEELSDADLEHRLYPRATGAIRGSFPQPDWGYVHRELRRKGVTLSLLWEEYRSVHRDGYGYSRFCELYSRWEGKLSPVMRQRHPAGERLFVDYAGATMDVACPKTGEVRTAQLFVATLGASNYTYVEASWTQTLPDWISSHVRAFEFFGGVSAQVVPDNLKAGVTKACFYDPAINRTYGDMARHYDTAIVPARPKKPKDKAKVEGAVLLVERWITARLRNQFFFSLDDLNAAVRPLLGQLNNKVTRHLGASRKDLFEKLDKPALKSLPVEPYVYAEWKQCRAGLDYHIDIGRHYYSVPHQLLKQKLWARITARTVEVYFKGKRVAAHARSSGNLIITGPCGVGKTWLACALAQAACREGKPVLYRRLPRLFDELELAHGDGRFPRLFRSLTKTDLLILDDWGPDRLNASQRRDLMEIIEDRYETGSTLITSQLPVDTWHEVIGEPTFADAILDRIVHNSYRMELEGQSMRKTRTKTVDESNKN